MLLVELEPGAQGTLAADEDDAIEFGRGYLLGGAGATVLRLNVRRASRSEDGAAALQDVCDGSRAKSLEIAAHEAVKAVSDAPTADANGCRGTDDGANRRVHAGRITPASENAYLSHCSVFVPL